MEQQLNNKCNTLFQLLYLQVVTSKRDHLAPEQILFSQFFKLYEFFQLSNYYEFSIGLTSNCKLNIFSNFKINFQGRIE
jgi:hypothetical protein